MFVLFPSGGAVRYDVDPPPGHRDRQQRSHRHATVQQEEVEDQLLHHAPGAGRCVVWI